MEQQSTKLIRRVCARARCGHTNRPGARFCARCGGAFDPPMLRHAGILAAAIGVMLGLAALTTMLFGARLIAPPMAALLVIGVVAARRNRTQRK